MGAQGGTRLLAAFAVLLTAVAGCSWPRGPDVIFLPSASDVVTRMLAVARVGPGDAVYDLGCGDGRIVIAAARDHGARGVCVEIDPSLIETGRRNADSAGVLDRIEFRQADMFETDLGGATVVALYLSPSLNERLRPKLFREVRPGTRVVSHNFPMGDWRPDTVVRVEWPSGTTSTVNVWVVPADLEGTWELRTGADIGSQRFRVRFTQHYQELTGSASARGRTIAVSGTWLEGDSVEFSLAERGGGEARVLRFAGRVSGGAMEGMVRTGPDSAAQAWRGVRP